MDRIDLSVIAFEKGTLKYWENTMTKEQNFFNALRDIFVGTKVEGESAYINLMRIKSRYYEKGVFQKLKVIK